MSDQEFDQIVQAHRRMLYKICRVYAANSHEFDELFQEMLIQIWKSLRNFEGKSKLSTFLYRVAVNTALSFKAAAQRRRTYERLDGVEVGESPFAREAEEAQLQQLYAAISRLKPLDKALITLQLEGRSYDELAEITGLSKTNVGARISRAKKELVKMLQPQHL